MLKKISIKNFKSIEEDTIELGRVNVFIGANGCGKSSLLEAIAFGSAIKDNGKIHNSNLIDKGVRIAKPSLIKSSFLKKKSKESVEILFDFGIDNQVDLKIIAEEENSIYTDWIDSNILNTFKNLTNFYKNLSTIKNPQDLEKIYQDVLYISNKSSINKNNKTEIALEDLKGSLRNLVQQENKENYRNYLSDSFSSWISEFLIYMPTTLALRGYISQSDTEPLGIYGERLDILLEQFDEKEAKQLLKYNYLIDWLDDFGVDKNYKLEEYALKMHGSSSRLFFRDKYMKKSNNIFSSENANEGVLHLLFYLALFISKETPKFFAIDNIETNLNPHLCRFLMKEVCLLAKKHDKQVLITTHNPAILDGLNLKDEEIKLFEVNRTAEGSTHTRQIKFKPKNNKDGQEISYKLSELWTRGLLGAIPKNF